MGISRFFSIANSSTSVLPNVLNPILLKVQAVGEVSSGPGVLSAGNELALVPMEPSRIELLNRRARMVVMIGLAV